MNLAQLIPAEWAQDGCKPRHELARLGAALADAPAIWTVVATALTEEASVTPARRAHGTAQALILKYLAARREGALASASNLVAEIGEGRMNMNTACATLSVLRTRNLVRREGMVRFYKYAITATGRKALA